MSSFLLGTSWAVALVPALGLVFHRGPEGHVPWWIDHLSLSQ